MPARTPAPGGGSVAAVVTALAAGLTAMAARFAPEEWEPRARVVGRAEELRTLVEPLADEDARAYEAFLASPDDASRAGIADVPLRLAAAAAEIAALAARVAAEGNPNVRGDAAAAAELAAGAASVAARLVRVNVGAEDGRTLAAAADAEAAFDAAARAAAADG